MDNIIELDKKDREILFELDMNARIHLTNLSKKVNLSPQTTKYRIQQLEKKGIIRGYVTLFNVAKFGYLYYRLYIRYENVNIEDENKIINYFKNHKNVIWIVSTSGRWDLEILFIARNFIHFNELLKGVYKKFPNQLHNNTISVSINNYHQKKGFLLNKKSEIQINYGGEPEKIEIDNIDNKIICLINQNARLTNNEIGMKLKLNYKTIQFRIKKMEEKGIIEAYRTWIDYSKIGFSYYKSMIKLKKFESEDEKKLLEFCKQYPNIIYLITCVWPWDIELEIQSKTEKVFLDILRQFRIFMGSQIVNYETLTINEEYKLNYYPFA